MGKNSSKTNIQAHAALSFAFNPPPNREEFDALSAGEAGSHNASVTQIS
jgi:hypothetical protein